MKTAIFDIDGTIANIEHRRKYLETTPPDWKKFNGQMGDDTPNIPIVSLYKALWENKSFNLLLVTGRNEKYRNITEQWLAWNEIPFSSLLMRPDNDYRADHVIKEEILHTILKDGHDIEFAVDDRQQVVDMWRRNGITCLQCDVGNF